MKIGDKLRAKWTENFADFVTQDAIYEVIKVDECGFWIINDKGKECFPVSTSFTKIGT
jgi:hypothetical protein